MQKFNFGVFVNNKIINITASKYAEITCISITLENGNVVVVKIPNESVPLITSEIISAEARADRLNYEISVKTIELERLNKEKELLVKK